MNISQACQKFLDYSQYTKNLSPLTIKAYKQDTALLVNLSGKNTLVNTFTRETIKECINLLFAKGQSKATIKRRLACFKSFFKWLENEEIIEQNPFHKLDLKIKLPQNLPRNLNHYELKCMLRAAKAKLNYKHVDQYKEPILKENIKRNINQLTILVSLELLLTTGIRVSELTNININDIHIQDRYIHIKGKGQRERRVFIANESIKNLIEQYQVYRDLMKPNHNTFLINRLGNSATPQTIRIWMAKLSKTANLSRKATPHMYRHSAATNLLEAGVDISYVQKLLGHQSITTTQIYTHVNNTDLYKSIVKANIQRKIL